MALPALRPSESCLWPPPQPISLVSVTANSRLQFANSLVEFKRRQTAHNPVYE